MHHLVMERWSRGASALHRVDPRAKTIALLVFLAALATAHRALPQLAGALALLLCGSLLWARIPVWPALARAALVLPFAAAFVAACWISGDPARGAALAMKSYLSALAVLFARSYGRAEEVHRAMLARGFNGRWQPMTAPRFRASDGAFLLLAAAAPVAVRLVLERMA